MTDFRLSVSQSVPRLIFGTLRRVGKEARFYFAALDGVDATFDTTQCATRRNGGQPRAKKSRLDKAICNLGNARNRCRRIVAPKVAGSSPVGHPRGGPVEDGHRDRKW
jgi:hypothetical protein